MIATSPILLPELRLDQPIEVSSLGHAKPEKAKVEALFADRRIMANLKWGCLNGQSERSFLCNLHSLQAAIYRLDRYGESNWEIQETDLRKLWQEINRELGMFGLNSFELEEYVNQIKGYQRIEVGLRHGRIPTAIPMHHFYSLKTCDVRLARRLIVLASGNQLLQALTPLWNYYDLASEVCDDLTDIIEDSRDFNCNRFLISEALLGDRKTEREYSEFVENLFGRVLLLQKAALNSDQTEARLLCKWTIETLQRTRSLLRHYYATDLRLSGSPRVVLQFRREVVQFHQDRI